MRLRSSFKLLLTGAIAAGSAFSTTILVDSNAQEAAVAMQQAAPVIVPPFPQTREFRLLLYMPAGDLTPFAELPHGPSGLIASLPPTIDSRSASIEPAGYRAQEVQHLQPTLVFDGTEWRSYDPWTVIGVGTPEPGTMLLIGCALAGLVALRLRRIAA
jgi:hypothetical protein